MSLVGYLGEAITLPRYAQMIAYDECRFFGVQKNTLPHGCKEFWTERERLDSLRYLNMAQAMIEEQLNYPVVPKWSANEEHRYTQPVRARLKHVIEPGVMAVADVAAGEPVVDKSADPYVIGPVATGLTLTSEIKVFHTDTDEEIMPSKITIAAGSLTIEIPRCRMVKPALKGDVPVEYDTLSNFVDDVDVRRIYNDPSTNATLIWPHTCTALCNSNGCSQDTQTACIYVLDSDIGTLSVRPATYDDGWKGVALSCFRGQPYKLLLNYRAGLQTMSSALEDAILRLAHALMPAEPCSCDFIQRLWKRDRDTPQVLTAERLNCPFGLSNGAWIAYRFVMNQRVQIAFTL
jgi:hypothetical protein